ncbi:MAG TPA: YtoQ family protein [Pseudogracilibacillus sp.]|nr:YtoQ family protein [Pseudogracilibacillus sp.]
MNITVYLAGEIHSNWREELQEKAQDKKLPLTFVAPQTDHDRSDGIGEEILGEQPNALYRDETASQINNFRTTVLLQKADVVIALFGEKYRQWNTAMDTSTAIAMNKPTIIIRPESLIHPLKELSNKANVTVETVDQALQVLQYVFDGLD